MFRGNYRATVDAKGRLKIPADFLPELRKDSDEFYVTSERGDCAHIYPMKRWQEIEAKLALRSAHDPIIQKYMALTSYYGQVVRLDAQARILIPQVLRETAQVAGEVVVLGAQRHLDVWNRQRFVDQKVHASPWTDDNARHLSDLSG